VAGLCGDSSVWPLLIKLTSCSTFPAYLVALSFVMNTEATNPLTRFNSSMNMMRMILPQTTFKICQESEDWILTFLDCKPACAE